MIYKSARVFSMWCNNSVWMCLCAVCVVICNPTTNWNLHLLLQISYPIQHRRLLAQTKTYIWIQTHEYTKTNTFVKMFECIGLNTKRVTYLVLALLLIIIQCKSICIHLLSEYANCFVGDIRFYEQIDVFRKFGPACSTVSFVK